MRHWVLRCLDWLLRTGAWGNGMVRGARNVDFEGAPVLEVTTRDFQEGGRFDLTTPVDITSYQTSGFIRLRLRFKTSDAGGAATGPGGMPGGAPGNPGPGGAMPGPVAGPQFEMKPRWQGAAQMGALPPLGVGGGFPAVPDNPATAGPAAPVESTKITALQVTLVREQGVTTGLIPVNLNNMTADVDGRHLFVLPLSKMHSTADAQGSVTRVLLTGDNQDTFYVAQAALAVETRDISVSIRRPSDQPGTQSAEITVKPGPISLIADVEAGAADPDIVGTLTRTTWVTCQRRSSAEAWHRSRPQPLEKTRRSRFQFQLPDRQRP